ncbi:uncharacterized protein PgNI_12273 [Pyricularia grisea]|uniref:FAD linked oxidase N-terminal domain-containing protein n=1 Tax=Pyricularia grisea TaxID=148305 RepID=A0A6P8AMQ8_PYRGI|nr:uncharacterized protein PgNI_12273 [Pyricularia grisea]TLD03306.1 hypothetical protein PgNI_12273 [Pyricularia grisea]
MAQLRAVQILRSWRLWTKSTFLICDILEAVGLGNRLSRNLSTLYDDTLSAYWPLDSTQISPACIFFPQSAEEVATAVEVLGVSGTDNNDGNLKGCNQSCKFAVRGAGHTANPGANNIRDGVTIDFSELV